MNGNVLNDALDTGQFNETANQFYWLTEGLSAPTVAVVQAWIPMSLQRCWHLSIERIEP